MTVRPGGSAGLRVVAGIQGFAGGILIAQRTIDRFIINSPYEDPQGHCVTTAKDARSISWKPAAQQVT